MDYYDTFDKILLEELVVAQGCTEPIAIAYAAAYAREVLGSLPDSVKIGCSGNIIKNVKSVVVPNSDNMTGIQASAILGIIGGKSSLELQVLSEVTPAQREEAKAFIKTHECKVYNLDSPCNLHIVITLVKGDDTCEVEIKDLHNNIVKVVKNGKVLLEKKQDCKKYCGALTPRDSLNFERIYDYAKNAPLDKVLSAIRLQKEYNYSIACEGITADYGVGIGKSTARHSPDSIYARMKAYTAAASEARMCGCTLPVVTNSGSGNQGIASSVPLVVYAKENDIPEETLDRALAFSNLMTVYQKTSIGRLSAFCGAISATCGAVSGLAFMLGYPKKVISDTIINTLADDIGVVCDGAKASCAAKIACGLDAAFNAFFIAIDGKRYPDSCGIVDESVDKTIANVGRMASCGMQSTDKEILEIMLEK